MKRLYYDGRPLDPGAAKLVSAQLDIIGIPHAHVGELSFSVSKSVFREDGGIRTLAPGVPYAVDGFVVSYSVSDEPGSA